MKISPCRVMILLFVREVSEGLESAPLDLMQELQGLRTAIAGLRESITKSSLDYGKTK